MHIRKKWPERRNRKKESVNKKERRAKMTKIVAKSNPAAVIYKLRIEYKSCATVYQHFVLEKCSFHQLRY